MSKQKELDLRGFVALVRDMKDDKELNDEQEKRVVDYLNRVSKKGFDKINSVFDDKDFSAFATGIILALRQNNHIAAAMMGQGVVVIINLLVGMAEEGWPANG